MSSSQPYIFYGIDNPNGQPLPIMGHFVLHVVTYPAINGNMPIAPSPIMPPITPPDIQPVTPINPPPDQDSADTVANDEIGGWTRAVQGAPENVMFRRQQISQMNRSANGNNNTNTRYTQRAINTNNNNNLSYWI